jgi:hypothetical protein
MPAFARQTAVPCTLAELRDGQWVQNEGLIPSGVKTGRGLISRASIIGVITDKSNSGITVEDGTTPISVRSFEQKPIYADVGDIVLIIGRPREYNGERYIVLEICKKLKNPAWVQYRKRELTKHMPVAFEIPVIEAPRAPAQPIAAPQTKNPFELIVETIRTHDKGPGADIEDVLANVKVPEAQKFLQTLIEEGEIFEIRPGRLKVLE